MYSLLNRLISGRNEAPPINVPPLDCEALTNSAEFRSGTMTRAEVAQVLVRLQQVGFFDGASSQPWASITGTRVYKYTYIGV